MLVLYFVCFQVTLCRALKRIARDGTTVVLSIHQPRAEIFDLFTQIVFLTKDGRVAYCGPPKGVLPYLQTNLATLSLTPTQAARAASRPRLEARPRTLLAAPQTQGSGGGGSSSAAANPADALLDLMAVRAASHGLFVPLGSPGRPFSSACRLLLRVLPRYTSLSLPLTHHFLPAVRWWSPMRSWRFTRPRPRPRPRHAF